MYEIAQVTIIVENQSPESKEIDREGIVVYAQDEVRNNDGRPAELQSLTTF